MCIGVQVTHSVRCRFIIAETRVKRLGESMWDLLRTEDDCGSNYVLHIHHHCTHDSYIHASIITSGWQNKALLTTAPLSLGADSKSALSRLERCRVWKWGPDSNDIGWGAVVGLCAHGVVMNLRVPWNEIYLPTDQLSAFQSKILYHGVGRI
jgi:hypothetical protein